MTKKFEYEQPCSRCGGSCIDPDMADCTCDCCEGGIENVGMLTEAEAKSSYPAAVKRQSGRSLP